MLTLLVVGLFAGSLTTVVGLGGGLLAITALSLTMDHTLALAISAPALLVGNLHRFWMYRSQAAGRELRGWLFGLSVGAAAVGTWVPSLPAWFIAVTMTAVSLLGVWMAHRRLVLTVSAQQRLPLGLVVGGVVAASGPAGVIAGPVLRGMGYTGTAYLATMSLASVLLHTGRVVGYGLGGALSPALLPSIAVITVAIMFGNQLGHRMRARVPAYALAHCEVGAPVLASALALIGLL